ncbi:DUF4136 domain-containing protein [Shewanella maritima]|uniref:DUF4136 domain-containing protein n=1 Tax=Shewanella maritima TaxID=2520507 RepID=UPI003735F986
MTNILAKSLAVLVTVLTMGCAQTTETDTAQSRLTMVISGDAAILSNDNALLGWHPTMFTIHTDSEQEEAEIQRHMRASLTKIMQQKGYRFANSNESANVLIGFGLALESQMSDAEILERAGLVAGLSTHGVDDKFEKGSVMVALFSPMQQQPVWRVLAQGFTNPNAKLTDREQRFDELALKMLHNIPVK